MSEMQELKAMIKDLAVTMTEQLDDLKKELKADISELKSDVNELKADVKELKQRADEQQIILSAIKTGNEHNTAVLDQINMRLAHIEGDVKDSLDTSFGLSALYSVQARKIKSIEDRLNN